jgi:hypothetical protein
MALPVDISYPEQFRIDHSLGAETIQQIQRDFQRNGLEINLPETPPPTFEQLCERLAELVDWLLQRDHSRFMQLLYRIDLNEQQIRQALDLNQEQSIAERLAVLIVRREAQKVLLRRYFSRGGQT